MTAGRPYQHRGSDQCSATCEEGVWLGLCVLLACLARLLERGQPKCCRSAGLWQPNHLPNTHTRYLRCNKCFGKCPSKIQVCCLHAVRCTVRSRCTSVVHLPANTYHSNGKALPAVALLSLLITGKMAVVYRLQWYTHDCESMGMLAERASSTGSVRNRMQ